MDKKIICLDDCNITLKKIERVFSKEGYEVYSTNSWAEVNQFIFKNKVELLLCDVNMPGISGDKICMVLRETVPQMKIILFSDLPDQEIEQLANKSKAHGWINKSLPPQQWVKVLEKFISSFQSA